jgi:peptidoglycan/xylan/chitin deacetylase (PgdA/CDA1 family)
MRGSGEASAAKLSLTFDNGPNPGITDKVLDVLADFDVKATFFLVGKTLEQPGARALAERAFVEGHRLGNHSYSHGTPLGLRDDPAEAVAEIEAMFALMGELAGDVPLFRPNGRGELGEHMLGPETLDCLIRRKASIVLWNSVPRDRMAVVDRPDVWVDDAREAVMARDWTVMVLHDRPSGFSDPAPMDYLGDFLRWARDRNFTFTGEFPRDCTPLVRGEPQDNLHLYLTR